MVLYILTSYWVLGIVSLDQLSGARHAHIYNHDTCTNNAFQRLYPVKKNYNNITCCENPSSIMMRRGFQTSARRKCENVFLRLPETLHKIPTSSFAN